MRAQHLSNVAYDHVGQYQQDQVNGLNDELLDKFISLANIRGDEQILDAMGGNGNLSKRIFNYCHHKNISLPEITMLEYSKVQCEYALDILKDYPADVMWGDILSMLDLSSHTVLESDQFDVVFIKSANHEIPLSQQERLYENILRVLKPGGVFLNLGFVFYNISERDEFREIARTKDRLANMLEACENRHFLTQDEFYQRLSNVGFTNIACSREFNYSIRSSEVAKQYGTPENTEQFCIKHQLAQIHASNLRKNGRIDFHGNDSLMHCPGELTIAFKPYNSH